jgi:hypothetical protein
MGVTGVLALVVAADLAGLLPAGGDDASPAPDAGDESPRGRYLALAARVADEEAIVARAPAWRAALAAAESAWADTGQRLVRAPTVELAETKFREFILGAVQDVRLVSPARIAYQRDGAPAPAGPVRTLRLTLEFDARTPADAYAVIDRVQHLDAAHATIESLRVDGPGRIQAPKQVKVFMTIRALALTGAVEGGA